jgi:hypothetical protein
MAKAPKDEFGTPFGQAGSAAATKLGTPFGQAGSAKAAQDADIAESDARLRARIPSSPNVAPKVAAEDTTTKVTVDKDTSVLPPVGLTTDEVQNLLKSYTSDVLSKMSQEEKTAERLSAYNILRMEFEQYGLGSLVTDIRNLLVNDTPVSEFGLRLRGTEAYKTRFKANEARIAAGLAALSPAEYVALEDQYQSVMRNYDLPESYYSKDTTGKQVGFEQLIASDVSSTELEDRIMTAKNRVINANPEVSRALKQFYPSITDGDILAYSLDPKNAIKEIQRKVTTAEIGGAALQAGLQTGLNRADVLRAAGVTKESAQQGFGTIAGGLQRGSQLASIYGENPYTQEVAETEVFNVAGAQGARKQRQKITGLEKATFGGQTGITSGALARDRAGGY